MQFLRSRCEVLLTSRWGWLRSKDGNVHIPKNIHPHILYNKGNLANLHSKKHYYSFCTKYSTSAKFYSHGSTKHFQLLKKNQHQLNFWSFFIFNEFFSRFDQKIILFRFLLMWRVQKYKKNSSNLRKS